MQVCLLAGHAGQLCFEILCLFGTWLRPCLQCTPKSHLGTCGGRQCLAWETYGNRIHTSWCPASWPPPPEVLSGGPGSPKPFPEPSMHRAKSKVWPSCSSQGTEEPLRAFQIGTSLWWKGALARRKHIKLERLGCSWMVSLLELVACAGLGVGHQAFFVGFQLGTWKTRALATCYGRIYPR